MSVTLDILASWRRPRAVMRGIMGQGKSEPFAFSLLVTGLILLYLSLTPFLAREAYFHPEQPLTQRLVAAALSMGATVPIWYLLAALGHLVARLLGAQGGFYAGRIALFWALCAASPVLLLAGLVRGMLGLGPEATWTGALAGVAFVVFWVVLLIEAEWA
jgi:hypothetical protein